MKMFKKAIGIMVVSLMILQLTAVGSLASEQDYDAYCSFNNLADNFSVTETTNGAIPANNSKFNQTVDITNNSGKTVALTSAAGFGKSAEDKFLNIQQYSPNGSDLVQIQNYSKIEIPENSYFITSLQYRVSKDSKMGYHFGYSTEESSTHISLQVIQFDGLTAKVGSSSYTFTEGEWVTVAASIKQGTNVLSVYADGIKLGEVTGTDACNFTRLTPARIQFYGRSGMDYDAYIDNLRGYTSSSDYDVSEADTSLANADNNEKTITFYAMKSGSLNVADLKSLIGVSDGKTSDGKTVRIYSSAPAKGGFSEAVDSEPVTENTSVYVESANGIALKAYKLKFISEYDAFIGFNDLPEDFEVTQTVPSAIIPASQSRYSQTVDITNKSGGTVALRSAEGFGKKSGDKVLNAKQYGGVGSDMIQTQNYSKINLPAGKYFISSVQYRISENSKMRYLFGYSTEESSDREIDVVIQIDGLTVSAGGESRTFADGEWVTLTTSIKQGTNTVSAYVDGIKLGEVSAENPEIVCNWIRLTPARLQFYGRADMSYDGYVDNLRGYISSGEYDVAEIDTTIQGTAIADNTNRIITISGNESEGMKISDLKEALGVSDGKLSDGKTVRIYSAVPGIGKTTEAADSEPVSKNTTVYVESENGMSLKAYGIKISPELSAVKTVSEQKATVTIKSFVSFDGDAIAALYNGNKLLEVKIIKNSVLTDGMDDTVNFGCDGELKVFVWDMQTLKPIPVDINVVQ